MSETAIAGEEDDPLATEEWESEEELEFMKRWIKKGRDIGEEHGKGGKEHGRGGKSIGKDIGKGSGGKGRREDG